MKAITVWQPFAWAIAHGGKPIENRTWSRSYRGPLAIHAGKRWDDSGEFSTLVQRAWDAAGHATSDLQPGYPAIAVGAVVAVVDLVDICTVQGGYTDCDCGRWAVPFQCHWKLANVRSLAEPVPCRGAQQIWNLPPQVDAAVTAQLTTPQEAGAHG